MAGAWGLLQARLTFSTTSPAAEALLFLEPVSWSHVRTYELRGKTMLKQLIVLVALVIVVSACGKSDKVEKQQNQLQMQADQARLNLQEKADALARNPPPELIKAAQEQAAAAAKAEDKK
jgi:hypothetical protein